MTTVSSEQIRGEHDLIGDVDAPAGAYWGTHTARAIENFPISGVTLASQPYFVAALATVKQAAAVANHDVGELLGPVEMHPVAGAADRCHVLGGRAAGVPVLSLSAAVGPPGLELTVAGAADRWRITLPDPATARPAMVARDLRRSGWACCAPSTRTRPGSTCRRCGRSCPEAPPRHRR